jgi:hypothetical protein
MEQAKFAADSVFAGGNSAATGVIKIVVMSAL